MATTERIQMLLRGEDADRFAALLAERRLRGEREFPGRRHESSGELALWLVRLGMARAEELQSNR